MGHLRRQSAQGSAGREGHSTAPPLSQRTPGLGLGGPTCLLGRPPGLDGAWEPGAVSRRASEKLGHQPALARRPSPHPQMLWATVAGWRQRTGKRRSQRCWSKPGPQVHLWTQSLISGRERNGRWPLRVSGELRSPCTVTTQQGQRLARSELWALLGGKASALSPGWCGHSFRGARGHRPARVALHQRRNLPEPLSPHLQSSSVLPSAAV